MVWRNSNLKCDRGWRLYSWYQNKILKCSESKNTTHNTFALSQAQFQQGKALQGRQGTKNTTLIKVLMILAILPNWIFLTGWTYTISELFNMVVTSHIQLLKARIATCMIEEQNFFFKSYYYVYYQLTSWILLFFLFILCLKLLF